MSQQITDPKKSHSSTDVIQNLFDQLSGENTEYDQEVVKTIRKHLQVDTPHTKAGSNLATELIELSKTRSMENSK